MTPPTCLHSSFGVENYNKSLLDIFNFNGQRDTENSVTQMLSGAAEIIDNYDQFLGVK
jgi:hypothetical protein